MPIEFTSIASSSAGCSYILTGELRSPLLIDAGVRFSEIQRIMNHKTTDLEGCLVSHFHGDHCQAVPMLLARGVKCYASAETWDALGIKAHGARTVRPLEEFEVGPWRIKPVPAVHDAPGTFGFYIAGRGAKLLYLTDTAYSPYTFDGITHLCVECNYSSEIIKRRTADGDLSTDRFKRTLRTHMSLETLVKMLDANDLSELRETHLLHLSDGNSDAEEFKREIQRKTGKPVYVAAKYAGVGV